jgi:Restriction endonuclease
MKMTWSQLTPTEFEELCYLILEANEFTDIKWYGKSGGDRGRDLTAKKEESLLPSIKTIAKWVVQCKRYVTKPPTKGDGMMRK